MNGNYSYCHQLIITVIANNGNHISDSMCFNGLWYIWIWRPIIFGKDVSNVEVLLDLCTMVKALLNPWIETDLTLESFPL